MFELILKKKLLMIAIIVILSIFAFGFLGTTLVFTSDPTTVYRKPIAPEYVEACANGTLDQLNPICSPPILVYQAPSFSHLLGTDDQGRDEMTRLAWGTRHSLEIGLVAGSLITILAIVFGAVAAYYGGWYDDIAQFIVNLFLVLPVVPILILISYSLNSSKNGGLNFDYSFFSLSFNFSLSGHLLIAVIIAFTSWGWAARSIRSQVLSLKERNFINMAKISGLNSFSISIREVLPNMFSYISLIFAISLGLSIASEAGISVLGIGVNPNFPTLGTLLYWVAQLLSVTTYNQMIYIFLAPGLLIAILFVFLYVFQAEMDEIFNPRLRKA